MIKFVKNCRQCGPLTIDQIYKNRHCVKCSKSKTREYYYKNKERMKKATLLWKEKNPEKIKAYRAKFNKLHYHIKLIKDREYGKKYYLNHITERRKTLLKKRLDIIKNLGDSYVKSKLCRQFKLPAKKIPLELVELKRPLLKLKRMIKEING